MLLFWLTMKICVPGRHACLYGGVIGVQIKIAAPQGVEFPGAAGKIENAVCLPYSERAPESRDAVCILPQRFPAEALAGLVDVAEVEVGYGKLHGMLLCFFENGRTHRHGAVTSISYTCARGKPGHFPSFGNAAEKIFPAVEIYSGKSLTTQTVMCMITDRNCNTKKFSSGTRGRGRPFAKGRGIAAGGAYTIYKARRKAALCPINKGGNCTCLHSM